MLDTYVQTTVNFIEAHPYWGQFFTFFIAFLESLAVIGTIIPGSVTMTAVGALVGAAIFPPTLTITMASLGALTGDWLGYWFGRCYANEIRDFKFFRPYVKWFDSGESFFYKHGGKSVIIGRFCGPIRSFIPMIAGILHMHPLRFMVAVIPAAISWAIVYMFPGILLGALSVEMPAGMATKFILWALLGIFLIWLSTVLVKLFFQTAWTLFDNRTQQFWFWLKENKRYNWFTNILANPSEPDRHRQLGLLLITFFAAILFGILTYQVLHQGTLTYFNKPIFNLLASIHTTKIDKIVILITTLGDTKVILTIAGLITIVFALFKFWRTCFHWIFNTCLVFFSGVVVKLLFYSARPISIDLESSFPSGHTLKVFGILGFLAVIIGTHLPKEKKKIPYTIVAYITLALAFSRLYLGAHWLTDVIGSMLLALACISITSISYRRNFLKPFPIVKISLILGSIILSVWGIFATVLFEKNVEKYKHEIPEITLATSTWWNDGDDNIPAYRLNRYGNPKVPLNIQWYSDISMIKSDLENKGWKTLPSGGNFKDTISRLSESQNGIRLPLLSQLYLNQPPLLIMIKTDETKKPKYIIRLWESGILLDKSKSLYIGTVEKYITPVKYFSSRKKHTDFTDITADFINDIPNYQIKKHTVKIPHQKSMLKWNGLILKIR